MTFKEIVEFELRQDDAIIMAAGDDAEPDIVPNGRFSISYFIVFDGYYQSLAWC